MPPVDVFVAFDIETSGLDPKTAQITEIAAYKFDRHGNEIGRFSTLVNPGHPIPKMVRSKIPISDRMVANAPTPAEAVAAFKAFAGDASFVGHNCDFDLNFISAIDKSFAGRELLDTMHLARVLLPGRQSYTLINVAKDQGLDRFHSRPHRAWSDAFVTAKIFTVLVNVAEHMPATELANLRATKGAAGGGWGTFLNKVVRGKGVDASAPDKSAHGKMSDENYVAWFTRQFSWGQRSGPSTGFSGLE